MTDVVFAFGPGDRYFMESQTQWTCLPADLQKRFSDTDGYRITYVHHLVLGADDSYYVGWKGKDGKNYLWHKGLPATLATWLDEKDKKGFLIRDPVNLRISLGPNNSSYWAYDGKSSLWWNLPSDLSTAIDKLRKKGGGWTIAPRIVALGVKRSFVMINSRHGGLRNIESHYPQLHSELDTLSGKFDQIHHISLDQHDPANFVLTLTNGSAGWQIPDEMDEALAKIVNSIPKGAPAAARPVAQQRKNSGIGSALLKAVVKGTIMGLAGAGQQQQQGGGGGGGGGFVDMSAFTAGLQQNMWSGVDSAASMPVQ